MLDLKGTTRAQTLLRAFAKNPYGPPPDLWPSPVVLRRWLKRPGFCGAMNSILRALRYQADFHLTAAAASGAHLLHDAVHGGNVVDVRKQIEALTHLLRMSHIRHRFADPLPEPEPRGIDLIGLLRTAHPSIKVEEALQCFDVLENDREGRDLHEPGVGYATWKKTGHPLAPSGQENWTKRTPRSATKRARRWRHSPMP